jgi:nucleotide-binding universal stress UspA family protein
LFKKILLPIAGYESLKKAEKLAKYLLVFNIRDIVLLNIGSSKSKAHEKMKPYVDVFQKNNFNIQTKWSLGDETSEIIKAAVLCRAELICFLWKKKNTLKRIVFGNITKDVTRLSTIPVFLFKTSEKKPEQINKVLFPTDFEETDSKILSYITDSKLKFEHLIILHAGERAPDPETEKNRKNKVMENLENLKNSCIDSFSEIEVFSSVGKARKEIIKFAKKHDTDLIVIGKNDSASSYSAILGTSAEAVSQNKYCSVLIIPPQ